MLFISHSTLDKAAAVELQQRLLARGYACEQHFLDSDQRAGIKLGERWEKVIYENLRDCRALIVLCSPNWLQSKWCFAELAAAKIGGKEIFPVVLAECDRAAVAEYQAAFVNQPDPAAREQAFERLFQDLAARGLGPIDYLPWPNRELKDVGGRVDPCPYPGLPAFDERYAAVYFGRERETHAVLQELRQMRGNGEPRFLMVVGGSGSGKSSLLMAGVMPRLKHATAQSEWLVLPTVRFARRDAPDALFETLADDIATGFRPAAVGAAPDRRTAPVACCGPVGAASAAHGLRSRPADRQALRDEFAGEDADKSAKAFLDAARALALARGVGGATVLLPIDQFEEFLTPSTGQVADKFLKFLAHVCRHRDDRVLVIGTMRSDYLDVYERHRHALKAPRFRPWRLEPFPREQIESVILKPAGRAHVEVAPELLERLKQEASSADALPLLAFTLEKLYRRGAGDHKLDLPDYDNLGGMEGSIRTTADQIMPPNALSPEVESAVRLCFVKHLAQVNDRGEFVRLTARWKDLDPAARPVLEQFVSQRLLVKFERDGEVFVEVAHEAIYRCWGPLTVWLRTSADIARWRRDVDRDRRSAVANRRVWAGLTGPQLAIARGWPRSRRPELGPDELVWIGSAVRKAQIRTGLWVAIGVLIACTAGVAWWQKGIADEKTKAAKKAQTDADINAGRAERQSRTATAERLAAQSIMIRSEKPQLSLLLAAEGIDVSHRVGEPHAIAAQQALLDSLRVCGGAPFPHCEEGVEWLVMSPDGKWLATTGLNNRARIWSLKDGVPESKHVIMGTKMSFESIWFSPDSRWLILGASPPLSGRAITELHLVDLKSPSPADAVIVLGGHKKRISSLCISPDSHWLITGSWDKTIHVWDLTSSTVANTCVTLNGHNGSVDATAVSRDSRWLITGGYDHSIIAWDLNSKPPGAKTGAYDNGEDSTSHILFSPDNKRLITSGTDGNVRLRDFKGTEGIGPAKILKKHSPGGMTISGDSRWLVATGEYNGVSLTDLFATDPAAATVSLSGHLGKVDQVAFSSDSRWLATAARGEPKGGTFLSRPEVPDVTARLWDLSREDPSKSPIELKHKKQMEAVAFSPDNQWLFTSCDDGTIRRWRMSYPKLSRYEREGRKKQAQRFIDIGKSGAGDLKRVGYSGFDLINLGFTQEELLALGFVREELAEPKPTLEDLTNAATVGGGSESRIYKMTVSPDSRVLITRAFDESPRLWRLSDIDFTVSPFVLSKRTRFGPITSPDGRWLLVEGEAVLELFDLSAANPIDARITLPPYSGRPEVAAFGPDSRWLAVGFKHDDDGENQVLLWDLNAQDKLSNPAVLESVAYPVPGDKKRNYTVAPRQIEITSDGRWLVVACWGTEFFHKSDVRLWDLKAQSPASTCLTLVGHTGHIRNIAVSRDGRRLVTTSDDRTARLWDLTAKNPAESSVILSGHETTVLGAAFSSDGKWLVTGGWRELTNIPSAACLWDLSNITIPMKPTVLPSISGVNSEREVVAISPDDRWLVTLSAGKVIRLWNLTQKDVIANPLVLLEDHPETIFTLRISPDSRWLVSRAVENTAYLWDLKDENPKASRRTLRGHTKYLNDVQFSGDSQWLTTVGSDGTARLWSLTASDPAGSSVVLQHNGIDAIAISAGSDWLFTKGLYGELFRWPLGASNSIELARRTAGRRFTDEERAIFNIPSK